MNIFFLIAIFLINAIFCAIIILGQKRIASSSWAWFLLIIFVPFLGFIIFLLFGLDLRMHYNFIKKQLQDSQLFDKIHLNSNLETNLNPLMQFNYNLTNSKVTKDNHLTFYHEGMHKFENLLEDIEQATKFVYVQYYILQNDELGRKIINTLAKKSAQGIEICLLVDRLGSSGIKKKTLAPLVNNGGKVATFSAPHLMKINFRNHRKLCVIDGHIGYIGGFNVGNEYLGKIKKFGYWRDAHMRILGSATKDLTARFIADWNYCAPLNKIVLETKHYPLIKIANSTAVEIISQGPDTKHYAIEQAFYKMLTLAKKNIYIQTPYFIPSETMLNMLIVAIHSGVDVKIMIPNKPDHPFVYHAAISYLEELMTQGAKCYGYQKGFVHSKLIMVDGAFASIGSTNMDIRSFNINFEVNAFVYGAKNVLPLEDKFNSDVLNSQLLDANWYNSLSKHDKIKQSFCRLISPIL